jgi:hypothetical protein
MAGDVVDRIVEQNLGVYRAAPSRLQEDVSQEAQVASDYRGRLVYELLQNADDAMEGQSTRRDCIAFLITDQAMWMANSGRALTDADVQGLCGLGASSKVDAAGTKRASIGHKGLGFKSVLEITDAPAVFSRTHSFRLGEREARPHVEGLWGELGMQRPRRVPAMRFPSAIDDAQADARWHDLRATGFNTAFAFPFRSELDPDHRASLADRLLDLPLTTVLFLKHLESVVVEIDQVGRSERREWMVSREVLEEDRWVPVSGLGGSGLYRVNVSSTDDDQAAFYIAHDANVAIGPNRVGLSGPAWDGVDLTEVSIATLADGPGEVMPETWKHFHVFLPTEEPCPYPMLVNGAFATDLSRQHVRVRPERGDYNSHLVREAARLFVGEMLPVLEHDGVERVLSVLDRGEDASGGDAAELLHVCLIEELADEPLLPTESGEAKTLPACVLPSPLVEAEGELFRRVLAEVAHWGDAEFPSAAFCRGRWARVAADHGAQQLTPSECLSVLGHLADPQRSAVQAHESGGHEVDPVLELSALLWERADANERSVLEVDARVQAIFPIHRNDDGSLVRVALRDDTAFYPPQSARRDFPLRGLRFLCHSICWGALNKNERNAMLGDKMRVWSALFDVKEFRFQEVMQASVLPALGLNPTVDELSWRGELQSKDSLAAICQLAGAFTKPDRPLRYQRLQSDRAIFNLSRLPVPCVAADGSEEWVPAYRAYFGRAWIDDRSFEHVVDALPEDDPSRVHIDARFLVSPEWFLGVLESPDEVPSEESAGDDDEVDLDEDVDRALETTEFDRWLNFLTWIGVNRSVRLVHFHDVEDRDTGWLTTRALEQPRGWAFRDLGGTWTSYRAELDDLLAARPDHEKVVAYLYEVHDIDHGLALVEAAERDRSSEVAGRLFEHLIQHWSTYAPFADAQLALVDTDKSPNQRSKPQRALSDEITPLGDNLWLFRLRGSGICPTSRGPRRPEVTWRRTAELERRFSSTRGRRDASDLIPVLKQSPDLPASAHRSFCERIGVRAEMSPSTFTVDDADLLCRQLQYLYADSAGDPAALRHVIKPAYRSMFELLSGQARALDTPILGSTPLLAEAAEGHRFLPASDMLFAGTPGIKERSGLAGRVPIFVLEAEPSAEAPLTSIFGCRVLEKVLDWQPDPGECPLDQGELTDMRNGLRGLVAPLLARIRAERTNTRDRPDLVGFVERIEPVDELELACTLDGQALERQSGRNYFVRPRTASEDFQGFVVWNGPGWPPEAGAAQSLAMALADTLGVNLVETFLAFITSDDRQRRQLLDIAGASGHYQDVLDELAEGPGEDAEVPVSVAEPTAAPESEQSRGEGRSQGPDAAQPAAPPVPLHKFESLVVDGEPLLVSGDTPVGAESGDDRRQSRSRESDAEAGPGASKRAAAGTDLSALDSLGMRIAIAYEARRLGLNGQSVAMIAGGSMHGVGDNLIVEVHTPAAIARAEELSDVVKNVMSELEVSGVSRVHPGFDLLAIRDRQIDRLIELKSSGVDARVQFMSWNEWKSASHSHLRTRFWLYLAGNLRADLEHASPYLRAINDPFGSLVGEAVEDRHVRRAVQLRVREFNTAEHLDLTVITSHG